MIPAQEALQRLRAGNARFVDNKTSRDSRITQAHREALADGQAPFAIVLGCSDSRVPAELVFDQRLGDLFVIRVAGNVVEPSLIGSVAYAAAPLVNCRRSEVPAVVKYIEAAFARLGLTATAGTRDWEVARDARPLSAWFGVCQRLSARADRKILSEAYLEHVILNNF